MCVPAILIAAQTSPANFFRTARTSSIVGSAWSWTTSSRASSDDSRDFLRRVGAEDSDSFDTRAGRVENRASLRRSYASRPVGEDDAYVAGSNLRGEGGVLWAGHAAELNFCEHPSSA